jgi:glycosyltransferase involved in cell wall biosynthesis
MIGGAEQVFLDIVNLMSGKLNFNVLFISQAYDKRKSQIPNLIEIIELNRKNKFSIKKAYELSNILNRYNIVHVHLRHTFKYIILIKRLFRLKIKVVFHDHFGEIKINKSLPFLYAKCLKPDFYIGVSQDLVNWSNEKWNISLSNSMTLVNLPKIDRLNFNQSLNLEKIVLVGNIKPVKNQKFAIDFTSAIHFDLDMIGKIQDKTYYEDQIQPNLSESQNVLVDIDNAGSILSKYKFGLCTSISESGPLVILEYFVAGLPFLSYKTGGIADILAKYVPQYFLDNFEVREWKARYNFLNENYQRIPRDLIDLVIEREFNREVYAEKLLNIYNQCLDS